jgi:hypothetical protein
LPIFAGRFLVGLVIKLLGVMGGIVLFLISFWVAIHAWRNGQRGWAWAIYGSFLVFLLFPSLPSNWAPYGLFLPQAVSLVAFFIVKPYRPNLHVIPNMKILAGCGTRFYGATERRAGTFVTTQWFCLLFIPLIPIQSYRVGYAGEQTTSSGAVMTTSTVYSIYQSLPLNWRQVLQAYALIFSFVALVIGLPWVLPGQMAANMARGLGVVLFIMFFVTGFIFLRAR